MFGPGYWGMSYWGAGYWGAAAAPPSLVCDIDPTRFAVLEGGSATTPGALLLESGGGLLLESGGSLLLEGGTAGAFAPDIDPVQFQVIQ